jgi:hypothetical protein
MLKTKVLAVLWALSIAGAVWVTYNLVTGLEAKKQNIAYAAAVKEKNKLSLELRAYREKTNKELEKAQGQIIYLEGVTLTNEDINKDCDSISAFVQFIELRRNIQKELFNL